MVIEDLSKLIPGEEYLYYLRDSTLNGYFYRVIFVGIDVGYCKFKYKDFNQRQDVWINTDPKLTSPCTQIIMDKNKILEHFVVKLGERQS